MHAAEMWLAGRPAPLAEFARRLGYTSEGAFSRAFNGSSVRRRALLDGALVRLTPTLRKTMNEMAGLLAQDSSLIGMRRYGHKDPAKRVTSASPGADRHSLSGFCRAVCVVVAAVTASCGGSPTTPAHTNLRVVITQTGNGSDADGAVIELSSPTGGGHRSVPAGLDDSLILDALEPGQYIVRLTGLAEQCVSDPGEVHISLPARGAEARFQVDCIGQFAYARWFSGVRQDVMYLDEHGVEQILSQGGWDIPRDWSPDGQFLLVDRWIDDRCETYRIGLDGSVQQVLIGPNSVANAQWSPAGDLIAVQSGSCSDEVERLEIVLLDPHSLAPVHTIANATNELDAHPVWSPDGSEVAFVRNELTLYTYTPSSGELQHVVEFARPVDFPVWSPDGQYIAVLAFFPQQLLIVNRNSGELVAMTPDSIIPVGGAAAWLPDNSMVFNGLQASTESLYRISMGDDVVRQFTAGISGIVSAGLSIAPDGRVMFVASPEGRNAVFVANADGGNPRRVKSDSENLQIPLWRRTGSAFAAPRVSVIGGHATRSGFDVGRSTGREVGR